MLRNLQKTATFGAFRNKEKIYFMSSIAITENLKETVEKLKI